MTSLLLTSFETWLPHQSLNSSDVLLQKTIDRWDRGISVPPGSYTVLRRLPVDSDRAFTAIENAIVTHHPQIVICCGMAEPRSTLDLEWQAQHQGHTLRTSLDLTALAKGLSAVTLSNDAGNFVCNRVYYYLLNYLLFSEKIKAGLFIHVPPLPDPIDRWEAESLSILASFEAVLTRLSLGM